VWLGTNPGSRVGLSTLQPEGSVLEILREHKTTKHVTKKRLLLQTSVNFSTRVGHKKWSIEKLKSCTNLVSTQTGNRKTGNSEISPKVEFPIIKNLQKLTGEAGEIIPKF
jgi:hypothetical protein